MDKMSFIILAKIYLHCFIYNSNRKLNIFMRRVECCIMILYNILSINSLNTVTRKMGTKVK